ncbi:uncharacterized protein TNCV_2485701 [Trichonephila clavipes]|uniref:Uncharacterized protein n=1 Tax=Trichonephila clavipes TaxID=2585209 RepID=A0A8X6VZR6_TRICX|nr:uncharacterized protein TNCV_2485701 [Trichonephila clavipes]
MKRMCALQRLTNTPESCLPHAGFIDVQVHSKEKGIGKYGSLPRTAKEKHHAENVQCISSDKTSSKLLFPPIDCNQVGPAYTNVLKEEFQKGIPLEQNIPNISRHVDQKRFLLQERLSSNQSRYSLGEPLRCGSKINWRNLIVCYDSNCLKNHSHISRQMNITLCAETAPAIGPPDPGLATGIRKG